ncbi:hypothetical protein ACS5NO_29660 [Larkinella sp. GY13]|uniref:hypothetical protein n=1 Tax=Larkinella sp. GY13 TaxID=3453720 RepID=UPI003EEECDED
MKPFSLILTILFPLLGSVVQAQTGLTVFGDCSVAADASIGFFGDHLTLNADLGGEGSVVMAGNQIQIIEAADKTVSRLVIVNPTVVKVRGKLTVRQSLVVERGRLDVLPQSSLVLAPQSRLLVLPGSRFSPLADGFKPDRTTAPTAQNQHPDVYSLPTDGRLVVGTSTSAGSAVIYRAAGSYQAPSLPRTATPPWA